MGPCVKTNTPESSVIRPVQSVLEEFHELSHHGKVFFIFSSLFTGKITVENKEEPSDLQI